MLPQQIHFKPQRWPHPVAMISLLHTDSNVGLHSCTPLDNWIAVWMGLTVKKNPASAGHQGTEISDRKFLLTLLPSSL